MKRIPVFMIFSILILCFIFLSCFPNKAQAQVQAQLPEETISLLRSARIQPLSQPEDPHNFSLQTLDGAISTLSAYKGKVVILNFWATWCPPCRVEMPSMETLYQRYKNRGLEMLAVNLQENPDAVRSFIQEHGYTFPIPLDRNGAVGSRYGISAIPTSLIIDKEGKIIGRVVGSIYWDTPQVFDVFEALLR